MTRVPVISSPNSCGIALFGMNPGGRRLAAASARQGVVLTNTLQELNDLALVSSGAYRQLHSIVLVAKTGDDLSVAAQIYLLAVNLHILVTAILIHDPARGGNHPGAALQAVSDIIVHSPDAACIDAILESMVGC